VHEVLTASMRTRIGVHLTFSGTVSVVEMKYLEVCWRPDTSSSRYSHGNSTNSNTAAVWHRLPATGKTHTPSAQELKARSAKPSRSPASAAPATWPAKTPLEHAYSAVALNLIRLDAYWNSHPFDRTRTSHLARLGYAA
jgi:hypothetical protein